MRRGRSRDRGQRSASLAAATLGLVALPLAAARSDAPSLESAVIFGTTCAVCHEGECSGRLSFDTGAEVAAAHIQRYTGPLPERSLRELFALLETMKRDCAYPSLDAPVPEDGVWSRELLARLSNLSISKRTRCFIPMGRLDPGRYFLELVLEGEPHVHIEVVTRHFDRLLEEPLTLEEGRGRAEFVTATPVEVFVRLNAQEPVRAERMSVRRAAADGRGP